MLKVKGKTKIVKISTFNGSLNVGSLLIGNDNKSVYRLESYENGSCIIKDSFDFYSSIPEKDFFENFSFVILTSEDIHIPHGEILFKINGGYTISSPLDFIGNGIEEAYQIFSLPHQIAKKENGEDFSINELQGVIFSETLDLAVHKYTGDDGLEITDPFFINGKVLILN